MTEPGNASLQPTPAARRSGLLISDLLVLLVLLTGLFFRTAGLYWGEYQYLHPDERFLIWVGADMYPVPISEYFNTETSTLNPHNVGHGYYVYGTLPVITTRLLVQSMCGQPSSAIAEFFVDSFCGTPGFGWNQVTNVGRTLSAIADLFTVLLVYMIGARLFDRRVGVLGAAFSALAVLQIQQSHFFTTDTFIVVFTILSIYVASTIAVRDLTEEETAPPTGDVQLDENGEPLPRPKRNLVREFFRSPILWLSVLFGVALGLAVASKINAFPVALTLPVAILVRFLSLPRHNRERYFAFYLNFVLIGAFISLLTFRIAQPYAFEGPGFFNIGLNDKWLGNMREAQAGAAGDIDYPFALQWGRRPVTFSGTNMVLWGMGIPMGLLAWAGFLWAGWRMFARKGEWKRLLIPWFWVAIYFTWQSLAFNPTMRYQLPIYPILAMFAGWLLVTLWERGRELKNQWLQKQAAGRALEADEDGDLEPASPPAVKTHTRNGWRNGRVLQISAVLLGILGIGLTAAWAYAFIRIYTNPITRNEASYWMYKNIPAAVNVRIQMPDEVINQPLSFPNGYVIDSITPYTTHFYPQVDGLLTGVTIGYVLDQSGVSQQTTVRATVGGTVEGALVTASAETTADLSSENPDRYLVITFVEPVPVTNGEMYSLTLEIIEPDRSVIMTGPLSTSISAANGNFNFELAYPTNAITTNRPYYDTFIASSSGTVSEVYFPGLAEETGAAGNEVLLIRMMDPLTNEELASARFEADLGPVPQEISVPLDRPVTLEEEKVYGLQIELQSAAGQVRPQAAVIANESDFDDGLPNRVGGFDGYTGFYPQGVVFQSYWDDSPEKLERYVSIMDQSDYIVMSSNRQWGSIPRVPERYPMMAIYYRELLGCPETMDVVTCYTIAEEGMFEGRMGFELVKVFQSNPAIGPFEINDQFAEEAFTVYDHPKVMIFQKQADFDREEVRNILGAADFEHIQRLTPKAIPNRPANLMFAPHIFAALTQGGTWSELFNTDALQNRFPGLAAVVWYLFIFVLGLAVYPFVRIALPGLSDRGYPLARIAGLVLLAYLAWVIGSLKIPVTRGMVALVFVVIAAAGAFLGYRQRGELKREWREQRKYFLIVEGLFLLFFVVDLLIRLGNPDLWHPWKGGERPMDFAYFNAVIKSVTFPPYDPWYAGGYINYYYYGFVLVGMPTKLLGIVPSIAYNLILPSMFSLIAMAAFSVGWNIYMSGKAGAQKRRAAGAEVYGETGTPVDEETGPEAEVKPQARSGISPYWVGGASALLMVVLGNLGTVRMIVNGYQMLAAPDGNIAGASIISKLIWTVAGFFKVFGGQSLPYGIDAWYWNPSRAIPAPGDIEPITEFPFFTVLYGDPHAHLFAIPVALLAIAFIVSVVASRARWHNLGGAVSGFLLGALAVGATYPLNLSDIYTYLPLLAIPLGYIVFRYLDTSPLDRKLSAGIRADIPPAVRKWVMRAAGSVVGVAILVLLSIFLYQPYRFYYAQGYGDILTWTGTNTPSMSYLVHWGVFLFIFFTWFLYETYDWMASTPLSSLRKLIPIVPLIPVIVLVTLVLIVFLVIGDAYIAWIALPMALWAAVLMLRPGQPDMKRLVFFMIGTGLLITIAVELIVVRGDVGRMNTVFKFYLQVWLMFALSAAAAAGWMISSLHRWKPVWRTVWQIGLAALVFGAALYPILATTAKIKDRWVSEAPHSLDGMAFMPYAVYNEMGFDIDLGEDYRMIRWLQENIQGSPVIVEANSRDLYRTFNRVSMYTGLPGVIGWENHQIQQRGVLADNRVPARIDAVNLFYTTLDPQIAEDFLLEFDVQYIILGQLERIHYPGDGLSKFTNLEGVLWNPIYQDGSTVIYEVINR